eukprot:9476370-Pyramimonas_sp.AAC.1
MHTIDLGVTSHILGNTVCEIVYEQIGGTSVDAVSRLWREIKQAYSDIGSSGHKLSFKCWRTSACLLDVRFLTCDGNLAGGGRVGGPVHS